MITAALPPAPHTVPIAWRPMSDDLPRRTEIDDLLAAQAFEEDGDTPVRTATTLDDPADLDPEGGEPVVAAPAKKRRKGNALVEWLIVIAVAITAALLVKTYVLQQFAVSGDSMRMTLHDGDRVLVNKLSYRLHDPNRGDVVVLKTIEGIDGERDLIKRVIGLPGETVEVRGNCAIFIDGKQLVEPYLDPVEAGCDKVDGTVTVTVPEESVFVLGDNRDGSKDSRVLGPISYDDLLGRAFVVIWPTSDWQWL